MGNFNRGLCDDFVDALNREYKKTDSWWRRFVDDKHLFIAIRDKYLDVYYCGARILGELKTGKQTFSSKIHRKFLPCEGNKGSIPSVAISMKT